MKIFNLVITYYHLQIQYTYLKINKSLVLLSIKFIDIIYEGEDFIVLANSRKKVLIQKTT